MRNRSGELSLGWISAGGPDSGLACGRSLAHSRFRYRSNGVPPSLRYGAALVSGEVNHKIGRDVGFRLRQGFGETSWAESGRPTGAAYPIKAGSTRRLASQRGTAAWNQPIGLRRN
jgi:hypothetical protein